MPSKRKSSACVDYVPALCTHRPSLLPIEWLSEALGLAQRGRQRPLRAGNLVKLGHLEEVKVVTRFSFRLKLLTYRSLTWATIKLPWSSVQRDWTTPLKCCDQLLLYQQPCLIGPTDQAAVIPPRIFR